MLKKRGPSREEKKELEKKGEVATSSAAYGR